MDDESITNPIRSQLVQAVERHSESLSRYALSLCGCVHRAHDAVQDTFLRLARRTEPIVPDERLAPWLFAVCRSRVIDILRKEGRMSTTADFPEQTSGLPTPASPSDQVETGDSAALVLQHLARLPQKQREVVRLKFQSQLSYKEIAAVTELSVSNVGYLLHTAIATLRANLSRETDLLA